MVYLHKFIKFFYKYINKQIFLIKFKKVTKYPILAQNFGSGNHIIFDYIFFVPWHLPFTFSSNINASPSQKKSSHPTRGGINRIINIIS